MNDISDAVRVVRRAAVLRGSATDGWSLTEWLLYSAALAVGKSMNPDNTTEYGRWIVANGMDFVDGPMRSICLDFYRKWNIVEPHTRKGEPLHGMNNPNDILRGYARLISKSKGVSKASNVVFVNGVSYGTVNSAINDLSYVISHCDDAGAAMVIQIIERLASSVIDASINAPELEEV